MSDEKKESKVKIEEGIPEFGEHFGLIFEVAALLSKLRIIGLPEDSLWVSDARGCRGRGRRQVHSRRMC